MEHLFAVEHSYLIPLLPLVGAIVAGFLCIGRFRTLAHWPVWITVLISAILSFSLLAGMIGESHAARSESSLAYVQNIYSWITAGNFEASVGFLFDPLSAVMLCVVTGIGFLIAVFAAGYMRGEEGYSRFFASVGLFIFMMTMLVMGNNFLMLYLGWEGVGLCSYLLIGYYFSRPAARDAARKAFITNRVGDFGFGLGIMLIFWIFGSVAYFTPGVDGSLNGGVLALAASDSFLASLSEPARNAIPWIPFLLMLGAFGKSAQVPLYVWLPDAMEGPTPVSALIHAATMVTAGVYMIARCGTLFITSEPALWTVAIVGAFTAIFSATIALRQFDLKKVFAYSTISQLGFMFVGVGALAPVAGIFHLMTHAFFKALLFLSSGVVMHAMLGHLDMRRMSGLKKVLPKTRWLMLGGCCALAGVPLFSGFFSKDEIVAAAWERSHWLGLVMLVTALLTAYYTFRLYFRVFEGPLMVPDFPAEGHHAAGHDDHHGPDNPHAGHGSHTQGSHHNHEPLVMILPLALLLVGAVLAGYLNFPKEHMGEFLGRSPSFELTYTMARNAGIESLSPAAFGQHVEVARQVREASENFHILVMVVSGLIALAGIGMAYYAHLLHRDVADRVVARFPSLNRILEKKYLVDEIYSAILINPLWRIGQLFYWFDRRVIDGVIWFIGFVPQGAGFLVKWSTQRGQLQGYAVMMLLGIVIILVALLAG